MRVIEPRKQPPKKNPKKPLSRNRRIALLGVLVFIGLAVLSAWVDRHPDSSLVGIISNTEKPPVEPQAPKTIQEFSPEEFKNLYNTFAYPNTQEIRVVPGMTGLPAADQRISDLAAKRGYTLRSVPVAAISKTNEKNLEGDDLLQPLALSAWEDLKADAKKDSIPLELLSGYRSVDYQRQLFITKLVESGANTTDIANGLADDVVNKVLSRAAPPGFSRHHTGYTIDLACMPGGAFVTFDKSVCFTWLKDKNYLAAKRNGWIPSYPEGTKQQGPEPESWEYVWVGVESLKD
jgi:LAS superfamily LD-carboxypeptidase LdcB